MKAEDLKEMLENVRSGELSVDEAFTELKKLPFEDIGFAKVDHHRNIRNGYPEVIFCLGKTTGQIVDITKKLMLNNSNIMATRASREVYEAISKVADNAIYYKEARIVVINKLDIKRNEKVIAVLTAGTADIPVAEEAAVTAETMGNRVDRIFDVGVAGLHRLLAHADRIGEANVIIVVAGMEGALASVVGGLVDKPVIAVPTSVGYGASFEGLSALLTMLNSCASGIGVVNIDNGFGAGYLAAMINSL